MGATLARLELIFCNLDLKERVDCSTSVDLACISDLRLLVEQKYPQKNLFADTTWKAGDKIVVIKKIPLVEPMAHGFVLNDQEAVVDTTNVTVMPLHKFYGGTSDGWGTDLACELNYMKNPGSFVVYGEKYEINDFVWAVSGNSDAPSQIKRWVNEE